MTRAALLVVLTLLTGCDRTEAPGSSSSSNPTPAKAPRPVGVTSGLSGETSALKGNVSGFQVTVTDVETLVSLPTDTLFAFDSAAITPAAGPNLTRVADLVAKGAAGAVQVVGYTDSRGEDAYNLALSMRRATAVADWLRDRPSLVGRVFTVEGRGEAGPVAPDTRSDGSDDPDGRARNRRVVVIISK